MATNCAPDIGQKKDQSNTTFLKFTSSVNMFGAKIT